MSFFIILKNLLFYEVVVQAPNAAAASINSIGKYNQYYDISRILFNGDGERKRAKKVQ